MGKIIYLFLFALAALNLNSQTEDDKDIIIQALKNEIKELTRINEELKSQVQNQSQRTNSVKQTAMTAEEYRIQLGVQNGNVLNLTSDKHKINGSFVNGKFVYDIGGFSDPDEAFQLSQDIRKLNLSGAFVTRYSYGVRDQNYSYTGTTPTPTPNSLSKNGKQVNFIMPPTTAAKKDISIPESKSKDVGYYNIDEINVAPGKKSDVMVIEE